MRTMVRRVVAATLCIALAFTLSGCYLMKGRNNRKNDVNITPDPTVKGSVTVYTSLGQAQSDKYLDLFMREYPNVKLKVVRDTPRAIADKLIKEKKKPVADVVWHTPLSSITRADATGTLTPYMYHPGQLDAVSADFFDPDHPDKPHFVGTDIRMIAFAVAPAKVGGTPPAVFDDLLSDKYQGQIVMPSVNTDAGYTLVADLCSTEETKEAFDYLTKLDKNVDHYTDDESAATSEVANGATGLGIGFDGEAATAIAEGDGQLVFPGAPQLSPWEMDVDALVNKPNPPEAAKTFLDWAISDIAMQAYAQDTPIISVDQGDGLPDGYPTPISEHLMQPNDFTWAAENHKYVVDEWMKRFGKKIKK